MMIVSLSPRRPTASVAAAAAAMLLVCGAQAASAQESRPEPPPATAIPERFSRQVAPTPSTYWRSPDLRDYVGALRSTAAPRIASSTRCELPSSLAPAQ